jgi:biotin synthase
MRWIRVSSGTAITLNLISGFLDAKPTTAYFLTYVEGKCTANCGFCPQAKDNYAPEDTLSRVTWPNFPIAQVLTKLEESINSGLIKRICIQALNYRKVFQDLLFIMKKINERELQVPTSISCQPLTSAEMKKLKTAGGERLGISIDAVTKDLFNKVKGVQVRGPYDWERHHESLLKAVTIFGQGKVTTHLIVGLGETEEEVTKEIQWCVDKTVVPALFAFTPIPGTAMEHMPPPDIDHYRRVQLARYLINNKHTNVSDMTFNEGRIVEFGVSPKVLKEVLADGSPFRTSGCPNCNRPYYNERPRGPIYNFPHHLKSQEVEEVKRQLTIFLGKK